MCSVVCFLVGLVMSYGDVISYYYHARLKLEREYNYFIDLWPFLIDNHSRVLAICDVVKPSTT